MSADLESSNESTAKEPFVATNSSNVTNATTVTTGSGPLIPNVKPDREEVKAPPKGLAWIMLTNMVISVNYSMLMVTGFLYVEDMGQSKIFYGAVVAAFPLGRLLLLMPMGFWSDRGQFKLPFAICNLLSIIGGLMYGFASVCHSPNLALFGRVVGGIGATQPVSAWAARGYPPEQRAKVESMQKSMNLMGVIVGPALNAFVAHLDVKMGPQDDPFFDLNAKTAAGYFPAILSFILLIGTWINVEEPPPNESSSSSEPEESPWKVLMSSGAWVCLLLAFQTNLQLAAIDTVIAELDEKRLGWGITTNSAVFAVIAILCLVGAAASIILLNKGTKCTAVIAMGLVFNLFVSIPGMFAIKDAPDEAIMWLFLFMGGMQCIAIMFYTGPTGGLYQQACGKKQGLLGGLYLMFFAAGRPCGSMLGATLLNGNPEYLCLSTPISIIVCGILHMMAYKSLNVTDQKALDAAKDEEDDISNLGSMIRTLSHRGSFSGAEQVGR